ncbi:MAG TPA: hypothetical protein VHV10_13740 [Ktedonobacteraceae bacterium]|nr:hypothetical protein [Ktedonobacteraceae bacterium]
MKQTILILTVLLTAVAALGQSLQDQKACYVQAHKVADKDPKVTVSNHYDAHTHKCWVKEFRETNGSVVESVYNAFEPNVWESEFSGDTTGAYDAKTICFVGDTHCEGLVDFELRVRQQYGF